MRLRRNSARRRRTAHGSQSRRAAQGGRQGVTATLTQGRHRPPTRSAVARRGWICCEHRVDAVVDRPKTETGIQQTVVRCRCSRLPIGVSFEPEAVLLPGNRQQVQRAGRDPELALLDQLSFERHHPQFVIARSQPHTTARAFAFEARWVDADAFAAIEVELDRGGAEVERDQRGHQEGVHAR